MRRRRRELRAGGGSLDRPHCAVGLTTAEGILLGLAPDVRAVVGRLLGGTRAAPELVEAQAALLLRGALVERDQVRHTGGEVRGAEDLEASRPAADGVVRARRREVVEPAEEVDRVGAAHGDDRSGVLERLRRLLEAAAD